MTELETIEKDEAGSGPETESASLPVSPVRQKGFVATWLVRIGLVLGLAVICIVGFCWYAYRAAQVVPDYYQALLEQSQSELDAAGDQFETELLELQNSTIESGGWRAAFSQDQINGWLASDLPQKFPDALPPSISNPRVSLRLDELRIVFGFESPRLNGIVECSGDLFCSEEINQLAIRIKHIRSGVLTLPISKWTDQISRVFQANGFSTEWVEDDGDAVILVSLPTKLRKDSDQMVVVESFEVLEGKVVLQGVTFLPDELDPEEDLDHESTASLVPLKQIIDR